MVIPTYADREKAAKEKRRAASIFGGPPKPAASGFLTDESRLRLAALFFWAPNLLCVLSASAAFALVSLWAPSRTGNIAEPLVN